MTRHDEHNLRTNTISLQEHDTTNAISGPMQSHFITRHSPARPLALARHPRGSRGAGRSAAPSPPRPHAPPPATNAPWQSPLHARTHARIHACVRACGGMSLCACPSGKPCVSRAPSADALPDCRVLRRRCVETRNSSSLFRDSKLSQSCFETRSSLDAVSRLEALSMLFRDSKLSRCSFETSPQGSRGRSSSVPSVAHAARRYPSSRPIAAAGWVGPTGGRAAGAAGSAALRSYQQHML